MCWMCVLLHGNRNWTALPWFFLFAFGLFFSPKKVCWFWTYKIFSLAISFNGNMLLSFDHLKNKSALCFSDVPKKRDVRKSSSVSAWAAVTAANLRQVILKGFPLVQFGLLTSGKSFSKGFFVLFCFVQCLLALMKSCFSSVVKCPVANNTSGTGRSQCWQYAWCPYNSDAFIPCLATCKTAEVLFLLLSSWSC